VKIFEIYEKYRNDAEQNANGQLYF